MNRITISRAKGWRLPPNAAIVDRRTIWGNPYKVSSLPGGRWGVVLAMPSTANPEQADAIRTAITKKGHRPIKLIAAGDDKGEAVKLALALYEIYAILYLSQYINQLDGLDLACWCKTGDPCHADILLKLLKNRKA